jgi:hypothetical protein
MGRQLLWNDYPTDQRGSYFRQFWDVRGYIRTPADPTDPDELKEKLKDIPEIHRWSQSSHLGDHPNRPDTGTGRLVLIVRGELLRRYPHADVYAPGRDRHETTRARRRDRHPLPAERQGLRRSVGCRSAATAAAPGDPNDPGWFFVFQPQAWEPRFGLEPTPDTFPANPGTVGEWNDLAWTNFATDQASLDALEYAPATTGPHRVAIQEDPNQNPGGDDNAWGPDAPRRVHHARWCGWVSVPVTPPSFCLTVSEAFGQDSGATYVGRITEPDLNDGHDPRLSPEEMDAGKRYWTAVWEATVEEERPCGASGGRVGPQRAAFVARSSHEQLHPGVRLRLPGPDFPTGAIHASCSSSRASRSSCRTTDRGHVYRNNVGHRADTLPVQTLWRSVRRPTRRPCSTRPAD